jgi:hypothetical protein
MNHMRANVELDLRHNGAGKPLVSMWEDIK